MTNLRSFPGIWTVVVFFGAALSAQSLSRELRQSAIAFSQMSHFGASIAVRGDLDSDGYPDYLIGGENDADGAGNATTGRAYVISGNPTALPLTNTYTVGIQSGERFGTAVTRGAGSQMIVGAPKSDAFATDAGRVMLSVSGSSQVSIYGPTANAEFGATLAPVGTIAGQHCFVVGAPGSTLNGTDSGRVELRQSSNGALVWGINGNPGSRLGAALDAGADFDLDGVPDVVAGAPLDSTIGTSRGRVIVVSGATGAILQTLNGNSNGDLFGSAVAFGADWNGDGRPETIVGAPADDIGASNNGAVSVHASSNGSILRTIAGTLAGDRLGSSVDSGDVNFDGVADVLIGAPLADRSSTDDGVAYVFDVATGQLIWSEVGPAGSRFGSVVRYVASPILPNAEIFLVGAPFADVMGFPQNGVVRAYRSEFSTWPMAARFSGGDFAEPVGDLDGDGVRDIAVGQDTIQGIPDFLTVYSARTGTTLLSIPIGSGDHFFGSKITDVGDQNGDTIPDFLVGVRPHSPTPPAVGAVRLYSGANGQIIGSVTDGSPGFGAAFRFIGDTDGDGLIEVAAVVLTSPAVAPTFTAPFVVRLAEFGSGDILWTSAAAVTGSIGVRISGGRDVDGDTVADVIVGVASTQNDDGSVVVLSGVDGSFIRTHSGASGSQEQLGKYVDVIDDQNADGIDDYILGRRVFTSPNTTADRSDVYSGSTGAIFALPPLPGRATGVDDLTGDGIDDLIVVTTNDVRVAEGGTSGILQTYAVPNSSGTLTEDNVDVVDDLTGDGFPDVMHTSSSRVTVWSLMGGGQLGHFGAGAQSLDLTIGRVYAPTTTSSLVTVSSGTPLAFGFIVVSSYGASEIVPPYVVFVDVAAPDLAIIAFGFDTQGELQIPIDIGLPALAGQTFFLQAIDTTPTSNAQFTVSNGLAVVFGP